MKRLININFDDLKIKDHFFPKYSCEIWTLKALLKSLGFKYLDIYLSKQWSFFYDKSRSTVFTKFKYIFEELINDHEIFVTKKKEENADTAIRHFIEILEKGKAVIIYGAGFLLPSHNDFGKQNAKGILINKEDIIRKIKMDNPNVGSHTMILSGFDKQNKLYHISDLFHSEKKPWKGWINNEVLIDSIYTLPSPSYKNTWLEIKYSNKSFEILREMIFKIIKRNLLIMKSNNIANNIIPGISGMKTLIDDLSEWQYFTKEMLSFKEETLYNNFLEVIIQREAFTGFLLDVQALLDINLHDIIKLFNDNYSHYCIIRNLFFKGSKGLSNEVIPKIKKRLFFAMENESHIAELLSEIAQYETNANMTPHVV